MAADHYRSAELIFGWSFYRQGSSGETSSADEFLDAALTWFEDPDPRLGTAWAKGERLAKLVAHRRTLLVLDGLEPLQNPPGSQEGRLHDPSLKALLRELAAFNKGLRDYNEACQYGPAGCWAHVRRGFFEAKESAPKEAGWILVQIRHLYQIEAELRQQRAGVALRDAFRSSQSRPIIQRIREALERWQKAQRFLPQSSIGKAISYALGQWESLEIYLQDAQIEIDNNLVENAIRPTALGKKNWLFFGDANAGERSAVIYSIIESCRRNGVEAYTYLCDVLTRLPSMTNWQIKDITPKAWANSRKGLTPKVA